MIRPGLLTTVQDRGRPGYRSFGVPTGGAFDRGALDLANALLANHPDAAALELTLVGGMYRAEADLALALSGARMAATIRPPTGPDRPIPVPGSASIRSGEILDIGGATNGTRTYLAVRGGWQTTVILGSRSTESPIQAGEILPAGPGTTATRRPVEIPIETGGPIRVVDGPDAGPRQANLLEEGEYRVSPRSDRMGLRLEGPTINRVAQADRPSTSVAPGTVQVAGGSPIILGVAGGTMGGYPHLAHVIAADLDRLGQLRPGQPIVFRRVEMAEARVLDRIRRENRARWLARIAVGCASRDPGEGLIRP